MTVLNLPLDGEYTVISEVAVTKIILHGSDVNGYEVGSASSISMIGTDLLFFAPLSSPIIILGGNTAKVLLYFTTALYQH